MFCQNCGKPIQPDSQFCCFCGASVHHGGARTNPHFAEAFGENVYLVNARLADRENFSCIFWTVISILQILIGLAGDHWLVLIIGILNAFGAYGIHCDARRARTPYPGLVLEYQERFWSIIRMILLNLFLGGVIGAAAGIYDLFTRSFVLNNAAAFDASLFAYQQQQHI